VLAGRRPPPGLREGQPRRRGRAPRMKRVGIVGLGYVGITLTVALARKGCTVFGCDRVPEVVQALAAGRPHVYEPGIAEGLRELLNDRLYVAGTLPDTPLAAVVLCVSTPVEAAEAVKLINNCHTDLIYSYGNEVALLAERLSLDPMELIRAANLDYPRPDLARPGFVCGGCLSKDPYILMASAAKVGHEPWL